MEDNRQNMELVEFLLAEAGYTVRRAFNADDLRREIDTGLPSLVLMDIQLPGIDGLQLVGEIRQRAGLAIEHEQPTRAPLGQRNLSDQFRG